MSKWSDWTVSGFKKCEDSKTANIIEGFKVNESKE